MAHFWQAASAWYFYVGNRAGEFSARCSRQNQSPFRRGNCPAGARVWLAFGWTLKAPEAELHDQQGAVIGRHYAGPTWKHKDGSEVTGKAAAKVDSPDPDSIPWLLVTATGHSGNGLLSGVSSIQRIRTKGGQPPSTGCDASKEGAEVKSSYTADYYFYAPAK